MAPVRGLHGAQGTHSLERPQDGRLEHKLSRALTSRHTSRCLVSLFLSSLGSLNCYFKPERRERERTWLYFYRPSTQRLLVKVISCVELNKATGWVWLTGCWCFTDEYCMNAATLSVPLWVQRLQWWALPARASHSCWEPTVPPTSGGCRGLRGFVGLVSVRLRWEGVRRRENTRQFALTLG